MKTKTWTTLFLFFLLTVCTSFGGSPQREQDRAKQEREKFKELMRGKLSACQTILEGLVNEDFKAVERGTKQLQKINDSANWKQAKDPLIRQQRAEFARIILALEKRATDEKLEACALKLVDLTMKCVECHRAVNSYIVTDGSFHLRQINFAHQNLRK